MIKLDNDIIPNSLKGIVNSPKALATELLKVENIKNPRLKKSQLWEKESGKLAWSGGSYAWHKQNPKFWDEFWTQVPTLKQLYCK